MKAVRYYARRTLSTAFAKGLTLKMGQTHMHKYLSMLLGRIELGEIDPGYIMTHRIGLDDVPAIYETFRAKEHRCIKVVLKPGEHTSAMRREALVAAQG